MKPLPYLSSSRLGFGMIDFKTPVVNLPPGASIEKIRCREFDFIVIYVRTGNTVEKWYCDFIDDNRSALKLISKVPANVRL